jgi:7-carboxy-7-deazaguanine synthase
MLLPSATHDRRLRPLAGKSAGTLVVHEIYRSLQGEGLRTGLPCTFVRLTACHLRCSYCDTPFAFQQGEPLALDAVVDRVRALGEPLVEITGGEPLLQPEVFPLMTRLADAGHAVLLETSGACDTSDVDPRVVVILDVKTPGSGESAANLASNLDRLKPGDEVKFVVCDRRDFDWSVEMARAHELTARVAVLVAPAYGRVEPADLAAWILESRLPLRLQIQLHKVLWGPQRRGV